MASNLIDQRGRRVQMSPEIAAQMRRNAAAQKGYDVMKDPRAQGGVERVAPELMIPAVRAARLAGSAVGAVQGAVRGAQGLRRRVMDDKGGGNRPRTRMDDLLDQLFPDRQGGPPPNPDPVYPAGTEMGPFPQPLPGAREAGTVASDLARMPVNHVRTAEMAQRLRGNRESAYGYGLRRPPPTD